MNVIIFHGTYGHPKENWFPWLKEELEKIGCEVLVPHFPSPPNHSLANWLRVFENYKKYLDKNSILVGHSIGCAFILNVLERLNHPIKATFLVAGFLKKLNIKKFIELNKTFVDKSFDWKKIKQNCKNFFIYNSDNDPYVPLEKGKELAEKLGVELNIIKGAGHFNEKAGYTKFEILLEDIRKII